MRLFVACLVNLVCVPRDVLGLWSTASTQHAELRNAKKSASLVRGVAISRPHMYAEKSLEDRTVFIDSDGQPHDLQETHSTHKLVAEVDHRGKSEVLLRSDRSIAPGAPSCDTPVGSLLSNGYIAGKIQVLSAQVSFRVQFQKTNTQTYLMEDIAKYPDGRTPCQTYTEMKEDVQGMYQLMVEKGLHASQIEKMTTGVSSFSAKQTSGACGYHGASRSVTCGPIYRSDYGTYIMSKFAHECFHAWEWMTFNGAEHGGDESEWIQFFFVFTAYANKVYEMRKTGEVPDYLPYTDYGLINENEWGAECFRNFLYPDIIIEPSTNWRFIQEKLPAYSSYWDCLWKTDKSHSTCVQESSVSAGISPPQTDPKTHPPPRHETEGVVFEVEDQAAIWEVCFSSRLGTSTSWENVDRFNKIVKAQAPALPGNAAKYYELGFGDCNHDGVVDWVCYYDGPGPGNSQYQWNEDNTCDSCGTWSFIVSGKLNDAWIYYRPDRVDDSPQQHKTLVQPWAHQWQSDHGSCNGAALFKRNPTWFTTWYPPVDVGGGGAVTGGTVVDNACPTPDVDLKCDEYAGMGDCTSDQWKSWMDLYCKCTCQKPQYTGGAKPAAGASNTATAGCSDVMTKDVCEQYVHLEYCNKHQEWMQLNCCKSCQDFVDVNGLPSSSSSSLAPGGCANVVEDNTCTVWANDGYCKTMQGYMEQNCCQACADSISETTSSINTEISTTGSGVTAGGSIAGCASNLCNHNGDPLKWNAGYGLCSTYAQIGGTNHGYCSTDKVDGVAADCVCSECTKCS